ncbi:hypothetical protein L873DRAFT_761021 [Choiromyces venosus 120613-1]|uniref:DDE-1 domain-containing protein n=1 Tax=Choiromyces venosus 120613-1 TaxID=1336337 RepID=A0A3N4JQS8_9PEZI|nr:hypothetical protein L873DRAFT_761021 [Choiromyces venosus 120613-1]
MKAKYIYNIDEFGIRIGYLTREIVIVLTEVMELHTSSSEDCKFVTTIKAICTDRSPPLLTVIICSRENMIENWVDENLIAVEVIMISPTSYMN